MYFVLILLIVVAVLFALDKIRPDYIALSALAILILSGTLTAGEALSAFGNTTVVLVAVLFIIGQGLTQTGITQMIGDAISLRVKEGQENRLISMLMSSVALLSSFMSNTGVVALFVPVVQKIAANNKLNIKRLLLPVAYGGSIGGMLTLIATPPNLIVSEELANKGYEPFNFLSFFPIGAAVLVVAIGYFLLLNRLRKKDPKEKEADSGEERMRNLLEKYNVGGAIFRIQLQPDSLYVNKTLGETDFRQKYDANILGIEIEDRLGTSLTAVTRDTRMRENDILYIHMDEESAKRIARDKKVNVLPYLGVHQGRLRQQLGLAEIIIPYNSNLIGMTLEKLGKQVKHSINFLGSNRIKTPDRYSLRKHVLNQGDSMLILGSKDDINRLTQEAKDLIVYNMPFDDKTKVNKAKALTALTITLLMILFLILNLTSPVLTVLLAALALVGTRCLTMEEAYQSISWSTVILIAAMLPFATALDKTGGVNLIVDNVMNVFGTGGPYLLMTGIFIVTVALSSFISNTATAVILAPIAIKLAEESGVSPYTLVMTLAIAASTAFLTPVATPVNMLVVSPGGYKFMDFVRSGFPLAIAALIICLLLVPVLFPLYP
jgi:di/tricarboxylate transporter